MPQINYARREISCKVVYYGPGLSGKTTNLEIIHAKDPNQDKGNLTSIATEGDRTLYFDYKPLDLGQIAGMATKFQLYTVPGQAYYNSTRKLVLTGADGVVFVADSQKEKMKENLESLKNLEDNLKEHEIELSKIPFVLQYNKRDLPNIHTIQEMNEALNKYNVPTLEAVAFKGTGVFETLKSIATLVLEKLSGNTNLNNPQNRVSRIAPKMPSASVAGANPGQNFSQNPNATSTYGTPSPYATTQPYQSQTPPSSYSPSVPYGYPQQQSTQPPGYSGNFPTTTQPPYQSQVAQSPFANQPAPPYGYPPQQPQHNYPQQPPQQSGYTPGNVPGNYYAPPQYAPQQGRPQTPPPHYGNPINPGMQPPVYSPPQPGGRPGSYNPQTPQGGSFHQTPGTPPGSYPKPQNSPGMYSPPPPYGSSPVAQPHTMPHGVGYPSTPTPYRPPLQGGGNPPPGNSGYTTGAFQKPPTFAPPTGGGAPPKYPTRPNPPTPPLNPNQKK